MLHRTIAATLTAIASLGAIAAQEPVKVTLGLYSFKKPTEVYKQFQPVAQALTTAFTTALGQPAEVELHVLKTYEECLEAFLAGKIDVVRFGPSSYVLAKQRNAAIELLAAEREDSRGVGLIVVAENSPVKTLADLAGRRFAFGDQQSTTSSSIGGRARSIRCSARPSNGSGRWPWRRGSRGRSIWRRSPA